MRVGLARRILQGALLKLSTAEQSTAVCCVRDSTLLAPFQLVFAALSG